MHQFCLCNQSIWSKRERWWPERSSTGCSSLGREIQLCLARFSLIRIARLNPIRMMRSEANLPGFGANLSTLGVNRTSQPRSGRAMRCMVGGAPRADPLHGLMRSRAVQTLSPPSNRGIGPVGRYPNNHLPPEVTPQPSILTPHPSTLTSKPSNPQPSTSDTKPLCLYPGGGHGWAAGAHQDARERDPHPGRGASPSYYIYIHTYVCIYIYIHTYKCVHLYIYIYMCLYTYICYIMYRYVYIKICVYIFMCVCIVRAHQDARERDPHPGRGAPNNALEDLRFALQAPQKISAYDLRSTNLGFGISVSEHTLGHLQGIVGVGLLVRLPAASRRSRARPASRPRSLSLQTPLYKPSLQTLLLILRSTPSLHSPLFKPLFIFSSFKPLCTFCCLSQERDPHPDRGAAPSSFRERVHY